MNSIFAETPHDFNIMSSFLKRIWFKLFESVSSVTKKHQIKWQIWQVCPDFVTYDDSRTSQNLGNTFYRTVFDKSFWLKDLVPEDFKSKLCFHLKLWQQNRTTLLFTATWKPSLKVSWHWGSIIKILACFWIFLFWLNIWCLSAKIRFLGISAETKFGN